jgi:hypothetical protein
MAATIAGALAFAPPAVAKTAKECRAEWSADKAANQAKGVTEKDYVAKCRADDKAAAKEEKAKSKAAAKEAKESKKDAKEKAAAKDTKESKEPKSAAAAGGKTAKECADEWRANKAANQAAKITEKAYVADCRAGKTTAMTKPAAAPAPAPAAKSEPAPSRPTKSQEASTPPASAPPAAPSSPSKSAATTAAAPASGKPEGANQFVAENQARSHCPSELVVWANLDSKIYHFSGYSDYGTTKQGAYMCEKDAEAQGMRAAKNEKHP